MRMTLTKLLVLTTEDVVGWTEGTIINCLPCASACVFSRWTFGQRLGHRRCTETVSLPCDCRKKIVRSHDLNYIGFISFMASNSPSNVLLKVEVFRENFVTVITLQLWTFSFQLLCWVKFSEWILILRSTLYSSYPRPLLVDMRSFIDEFKTCNDVWCSSSDTCGSIGAFLAAPRSFGNDDLFEVAQLCQVVGDAADLRFGALLPRAVDGRGGERLAVHTLTGHLRETHWLSAFPFQSSVHTSCLFWSHNGILFWGFV